MSGIYIPGMEMPTGTDVLTIAIDSHGKLYAIYLSDGELGINPLHKSVIPVHDHGRLIDADALLRHKGVRDYKYDYETGNVYVEIDDICGAIDNAPTVIPAEEGQ